MIRAFVPSCETIPGTLTAVEPDASHEATKQWPPKQHTPFLHLRNGLRLPERAFSNTLWLWAFREGRWRSKVGDERAQAPDGEDWKGGGKVKGKQERHEGLEGEIFLGLAIPATALVC